MFCPRSSYLILGSATGDSAGVEIVTYAQVVGELDC